MNAKTPLIPLSLLFLFAACEVRAQANDNPTGPAGIFNGNITTGCSYDPYTGNAMRSVTDIAISNPVGDYPLAFTRISNSRNIASDGGFAVGCLWRHSYCWILQQTPGTYAVSNSLPTSYTVDYPDGRELTFSAPPDGSPAKNAGETLFRAAIGISERFQPLNLSTNLAYLIFSDGGKVEFKATQYFNGSVYYRVYKAQAIIDPHGLRTSFTYGADGRISLIMDAAGRWFQLTWTNISNGGLIKTVISQVTANDGRVVTYSYNVSTFPPGNLLYTTLYSVNYYNDPTIGNAVYTYKAPNVPDSSGAYNGPPLLATCNDPMYAGPMKKIAYDYVPNGVGVVQGQLLREKSGTDLVSVSSVATGGNGIDRTRTETRGDGPSRTITYHTWPYVGHLLFGYTGFIPTDPGSSLGYDASNYLSYFQDPNGSGTSMTREPITGRITSLTHPPDKYGIQSTVYYVYTDPLNPYYLDHVTDELSHTTTYQRDSAHRIIEIDYPDGGYETFTYNSFNEVLTHRLTSGGTESWIYDTSAKKQSYTNADHKITYYYYGPSNILDRISGIKDPAGFETDFEYNSRGEVTKTTYPADQTTGLRYTVINGYNSYGSLISRTDELNHLTQYGRDDYQRITKVTDALNNFSTRSYLPWGKSSSYLTTSDFVFVAASPSGKQVYNYCDNEFRKKQVTQAPGTSDQAISYFTYDAVGNQATAKTPQNNQTIYGYDQRNRLISVARPLSQTTTYDYDQAGNKIKETRPDTQYRTWDTFDAMNRVKHTTGFLGDPTSYVYDFAGNMTQMTDSKGAIYLFGYDSMNRKNGATYPTDAGGVVRTESWSYDANGNLYQYTNPGGQIDTYTYDNRNRQIESAWNVNGPDITTTYDAASRVTSVSTADDKTVGYKYDDANHQIEEDESFPGTLLGHVITPVDVDGNRSSLSVTFVPAVYTVYYDYTQRQQLAHIRSDPTVGVGQWFGYTYDLDGNVTKRQDLVQGLDSTLFSYDALDRVTLCTQTGANDAAFAWSHYDYDLNNNVQDTWRQEQANKGERFGYDYTNQLTSVVYNADNVTTPNPTNYDRSVSYTCDALNRTSLNDNGVVTAYTPNGLNQYTSMTGQQSLYDGNFNQSTMNGWTYTYDAANRVTLANNATTGASVHFSYDGLNRCVQRVTGTVVKNITYDGWKPIAEWSGNGVLKSWNLYGPGPDEILMRYSTNGTPYLHYHSDQFGSVKFLLDQYNIGIEKYTYDAFGAPKISNWAGTVLTDSAYGNRFMFTGREYLSTIGIYDYRNRMYSPLLGRFLQTDPLRFGAGDFNIYRYVGHNPIISTDPSGLGPEPGDFSFADAFRTGWFTTTGIILENRFVSSVRLPVSGDAQDALGWYQHTNPITDIKSIIASFYIGGYLAGDLTLFGDYIKEINTVHAPAKPRTPPVEFEGGFYDEYGNPVPNPNISLVPGEISLGGNPIATDPDTGRLVYNPRGAIPSGGAPGANTWGTPGVGDTGWGNSAYMPGLLSSLVPEDKGH
jgi:RHS repeat-associated protein